MNGIQSSLTLLSLRTFILLTASIGLGCFETFAGDLPSGADQPFPFEQLRLELAWEGRDTSDGGLNGNIPLIGSISTVQAFGDSLVYLYDFQQKQLTQFSVEDGFLRVVFTDGEGPGEVEGPIDFAVRPNGQIAAARMMPGQLYKFSDLSAGDPIKIQLKGPGVAGMVNLQRVLAFGSDFAVKGSALYMKDGAQDVCAFVSVIDSEGLERFNILRGCTSLKSLSTGADLGAIQLAARAIVDAGAYLYLVRDPNIYDIEVYGKNGHLVAHIAEEYSPREYDAAERTQMAKAFNDMKEKMPTSLDGLLNVEVPMYMPSIISIVPRLNGNLWVLGSSDEFILGKEIIRAYRVYDSHGEWISVVRIASEYDHSSEVLYVSGGIVVGITGGSLPEAADGLIDIEGEAESIGVRFFKLMPN